MTTLSRKLTTGGLLIAVGILLPQVFHLIGGSALGSVLLPMHLPVLLGGLLLGPVFGGLVGLITPAISCLLTSMPQPAALPFMMVELAVYGAAAGLLYRRLHLPWWASLLLAQLSGRVIKALVLWVLGQLFSLPVPAALTVFTAVGTGIPGLILQWILVPLLLLALRKGRVLDDH